MATDTDTHDYVIVGAGSAGCVLASRLTEDEDTGALIVEDVVFDNLAIVPRGASPSNSAESGPADDMRQAHPALSAAELREAFGIEEPETPEGDRDDLSLKVVRMFGHIGLNERFLDESSVDSLKSDLESHDAVSAVFGEEEHDLLLVIDADAVDSNAELDDHVVSSLDDTPWEVWDDWTWIDSIADQYASTEDVEKDLDELHQRLIGRERFPETKEMETDAEIERRKRLFEEDPGARHQREMEERRIDLYGQRGRTQGEDVTATSMLSYLGREAENQFEILLLERGGSMALRSYKEGMSPPGIDLKALRQEAEERAFDKLEGQRERIGELKGQRYGGEIEPVRSGVSESEIDAVRLSLETKSEAGVRSALKARGVPEDKIDELLRRAR